VPTRIFITFMTVRSAGWRVWTEFPEAARCGWERSAAGTDRASTLSEPINARTRQPISDQRRGGHIVVKTKSICLSGVLFGYL
jgi:hypothetical protein